MIHRQKIATWGTFDLLHAGHIEFLTKVAQYGELLVLVIPDEQVLRNKGYLPDNDELSRKTNLENLSFVEAVSIDCFEWGLRSLLDFKPDIFFLGYDQDKMWEDLLKKYLRDNNLYPQIIRMERYANGVHSKHLRRGRTTASA